MNRTTSLLIAAAALLPALPALAQDAAAPVKSEAAPAQGPATSERPATAGPRDSEPAAASQPPAIASPGASSAPAATSGSPTALPARDRDTASPSPSPLPTGRGKGPDGDDALDGTRSSDSAPSPAAQATVTPAAPPIKQPPLPESGSFAFLPGGQLVPGLDNRLLAGLIALVAVLVAGLIPLRRARRQSPERPGDDTAHQPAPEAPTDSAEIPQPEDPAPAPEEESEPADLPPVDLPPVNLPPVDLPPVVMPAGEVAEVSAPVELALHPVKLSASLLATTLNYRLEITNLADFSLEDLVIGGGMISAHASLPVDRQLGTDGQLLTLLHRIPLIGPGETSEVSGDLRLPLNEITPVRSGEALLFIPIARFRVEVMNADATSAWVIGETPPVAAAALLPFRIDLGPRIWARISKRLLGPAAPG